MDSQTDAIDSLTKKVIEFRDKRDWKQFHSPKNLAISVSIEAAELLEIFQWDNNSKSSDLAEVQDKSKVEEEVADIMIYLLTLCHDVGIDPLEVVLDKLKKNDKKYPVYKAKGNSNKYDQL